MKIKDIIVAAAVVIVLIGLNLFLKPYLRRKEALKTVNTVLMHWKNDNLLLAMPFWENEKEAPPVYGLQEYQIEEEKFDKKDGVDLARISATLDFPPQNPFHAPKKWAFELIRSRYGWKIRSLQPLPGKPPQ